MPSCTSGSTLGCTAFPVKSTTDIMCIRSLIWCTVFASRCTAYAIMYIRRHTLVYCIPHLVYNSHHVHEEPHLVYCICQQVYCMCHHVHQEAHWCTAFPTKSTTGIILIRSLTWCIVFASRCTAYAIMYIRKHSWVYCIPHLLYNSHHVNQEPHLVYCICHHVHQEAHFDGLHFPSL